MGCRIAVDTGGTFTDLVIVDGKGKIGLFKSPSRPGHSEKGVFDVLQKAAEANDKSFEALLSECTAFIHGTTVATNAVLERKGVKTGLMCTEGFRDILTLGPGRKPEPYKVGMEYPAPYVPRYLTLPVKERINSEGEVVLPLDEESVRQAIRQFKAWNVESIAVCLLWSIVNPVHEQRIARIIDHEWPGISYSISSEVQPIVREYQRTCATTLDASLKPTVQRYMLGLEGGLKNGGLKSEVLVAISAGGVMSAKEVSKKPVYTLLSGPASGPTAGLLFADEVKAKDIICIDMGGTSFEASVVTNGHPVVTRAATVGGLATGINTVEVNTIGAGGGSIAWVDSAGLLHVGPQSAGAEPGPACYMKGGQEPTVTDANLILGYLNPDYFLGGSIWIDRKLSAEVIEKKVGGPLKLGLMEAAHAVYELVNHNMIGEIERVTIRRGVDPREYLLVVGGGAGAIHSARIAQELQIKRALIPRAAGVLCAVGMVGSDITFENMASYYTTSAQFDFRGVNRLMKDLEKKGRESLLSEGVTAQETKMEYFADARYEGQVYEIEVPLTNGDLTENTLAWLVEDFHNLHDRLYGSCERDNSIEIINWRVVARGLVPKISFPKHKHGGEDPGKALKGKRKAYFAELGGLVETAIYEGGDLVCGNVIKGPAIIEEPTTTVLVLPGSKVVVTSQGDYLMGLE